VKITDVRIVPFKRPLPGGSGDVMIKGQSIMSILTEVVAIRIETDAGVSGESLSLGGGEGLAHYIAKTMKPFLIGKDPEYREGLWHEMWRLNRLWFTPQIALGTVDVALWDLYGKIVGQPIYKILGAVRDGIPTYASSMTKASVGAFVDEALAYKERGFRGYKLHVPGEPKLDMECCTAVRKAVGDDYPLMIDVVSAYNQREALRVGRELEALDFYWYEEPLRDYDIHGYKMLADALDIPILAVEVNEGSLFTTPEYITTRAIDIVRSDIAFKGGIGPVKKTAALAEAFGMNLEVHTNPNPLLDAANLHVALSLPNTDFFEQLVPEHLFYFGVEEGVSIDRNGIARPPAGPGHGVKLDWKFIDEHKLAEL
jgi:L-alanine-DL-glutamate epimerase-like enolase superfamily enzyme